MSEFPSVSYNNLQGWIPETDIDGIDAKLDFLADVENIDFENGFIRATVAPTADTLPFSVPATYTLIASKKFTHSSRGNCQFYVCYKATGLFKFYLTDGTAGTTGEVIINNAGSNPTLSAGVDNLNFNFVNDQLKINMNVTGSLMGYSPVMNLTLIYINHSPNYSGAFAISGWYLVPRWLGWQLNSDSYFGVSNIVGSPDNDLEKVCSDLTLPSWITGTTDIGISVSGQWGVVNTSTSGYANFLALRNVKQIKLNLYMTEAGGGRAEITIRDNATSEIINEQVFSPNVATYNEDFTVDVNYVGTCVFVVRIYGDCTLKQINVDGFLSTEYCVIGKYNDGQRALLTGNSAQIVPDLLNDLYVRILNTNIDYRIYSYELYIKINEVFYLVSEILSTSGWSVDTGNWMKHAITYTKMEDISVTLTFNYGLGSTVRVDVMGLIYKECSYRGRIYFVRNDYKVYQSVIAANAKMQPDAFPYSSADSYGYFELPLSEQAKAICTSALEELIILTPTKAYIYYIQGGQGISLRRIKAINGNYGIGSVNSLITDLSGTAISEVIAWNDDNGIYIHGGGIDAPVDIALKGGIRNWWRTVAGYKSSSIGLFHPVRNELWFTYGISAANDSLLIYEIDYGRFRKHNFGHTISYNIGSLSNKLYYMDSSGNPKYYDYAGTTKLTFKLKTHYNTGVAWSQGRPAQLSEGDYKILQELFIGCNVTDSTSGETKIEMAIDFDGVTYTTIKPTMYVNKYFDKVLSPLGIEFRKIAIRLTSLSTNLTDAHIREFGYSFSTMSSGLNQ